MPLHGHWKALRMPGAPPQPDREAPCQHGTAPAVEARAETLKTSRHTRTHQPSVYKSIESALQSTVLATRVNNTLNAHYKTHRVSHSLPNPNRVWVRPLREEGNEPHPGPRYIGKNLNGLASKGRFQQCMHSVNVEHRKKPVAAVLMQEHNLKPHLDTYSRLYARRHHRVLWLARYAPAAAAGGKGHGTAIAIPLDSIEKKPGESQDQAESRVTKSLTGSKCGRVTCVTTLVNGKPMRLVSAYAPSTGVLRPHFFTSILAPHLSKRTILSIDANCVPDVILDTQRPGSVGPYDNRGSNELSTLVEKHELADVAREQIGADKLFTAHHTNVHQQVTRTRIDQIYAPNADALLWNHALNHTFMPPRAVLTGLPDHIGLELILTVATGERGKDLARIDPNIYDDPTAHALIATCIDSHFPPAGPPPADYCEKWTRCKASLRSISLAQTKRLRLRDTAHAAELKLRIDMDMSRVVNGTASPGLEDEIGRMRKELRELTPTQRTLNQTLEGIAYSKGQLHDVGSAAMYRRLHSRSSDQWINEVMTANWDDPSTPTNVTGEAVSEAGKIADAFVPYYKSLFAQKHPDQASLQKCMDALSDPDQPQVQPPTAEACGAAVTPDEVLQHCASLPAGKSPGPDILPNALYRAFRSKLAPILAAVYNQAHERGHLPPGMTEGLISVLYKKKDRKDPRNYRPITLLNGDYKILMRILTARLNKAVVQFVSSPQNGFVPGGFIVENILLLHLLQTYAEEENIEALFIFLDFEKAFDRCSWDYLRDAIRNLGFPDEPPPQEEGGGEPRHHAFLRWVRLAYSHDHPPTRRMNVNGYLSKAFAIASGVAQGCPASPLLFLFITEALIRIIQGDDRIRGILIDNIRHKMSVYADDSTLIARIHTATRHSDVPFFDENLATYMKATSMKENASKREAQLLGALAKDPSRAPDGVVANNVYPKAGESTRALGYPIGNSLSYTDWWRAKYRESKRKAAAMNSVASSSIVGRGMVLQAKYYSYFRYWLFGLIMPRSVREMIESDARHFLWSAAPDLRGDEDGTSGAVAPQIAYLPSHLPTKEGGAGVMHWHSHVKAFQLQWVLRYVDPRDAPWKQVLDHWIASRYHVGRKILFVPHPAGAKSFASHLPPQLKYMRACFKEFQKLPLRQDITILSPSVAAEALFTNPRFKITMAEHKAYLWKEHMQTYTVADLINRDTGLPHSSEDWKRWYYSLAPDPRASHVHDFATNRASELTQIMSAIPADVLAAAGSQGTSPGYVAFVDEEHNDVQKWARCVKLEDGSTRYDEVWLDANKIPHLTGKTVPFAMWHLAVPAVTWLHPTPPPASEEREDDYDAPPGLAPAAHAGVVRIAGTENSTFPLNEGWSLPGSKHTTLTELFSISNMTTYLTNELIGDARPNSEENWNKRVSYTIPWKRVWASLGTPLSDATEEKQWRKLLQRALNTRNRDSRALSNRCRLGCNCEESMLHLAQCPRTTALWGTLLSALHFDEKTPDHKAIKRMERAVIFGVQDDTLALLPMTTRAAFRHAWRALYRNLTLVDMQNTPFSLHRVVYETLTSLRDATLRHARAHVIAYCRWDGREDTRPKLNKAIAPYVTVDFVSTRPAVKTDPSPAFEAALGFARAAAHPDPA